MAEPTQQLTLVADERRYDLVVPVGVRVTEVSAEPGHPLERFADLVSLTDFAATYLALAAGLDPLTSPHVADLRDRTR